MNYDGTPVKAPPASRRKITTPTPQQSPQPSMKAMQLQMEVEDQENCSCGEDSESCANSWRALWDDPCCLSDCDLVTWTDVLVVIDVLVSSRRRWLRCVKVCSSGSDWETAELQPSSSSQKRSVVWVESQEYVSHEETPVKAPPTSRRRMMPLTPQQGSHSSVEAMQWQNEMEVQGSSWNARERTVIARMEQNVNESDSMKVEVEELEVLLGPEDSEVDLRHILMYARKKQDRKIFEIFSSEGPSEFLVVSRARWDEYQRMLVTQEEESRRRAQEVDCGVNQSWAAVYQSITRRMLSYLDNSKGLKVSTKELNQALT